MFSNMFKSIDLTKGKVWQVILTFSVPILLSYLFQQVYTMSDAAICGQYLNPNQIAGVNNTGNITFIVLQFAFGCTAGFSVVTAQKIGQQDVDGARKSLLCQIILSFIISLILTVLAILMINPLLAFIGVTEQSNAEIYNAAYIYTFIIFIGTVAQVFYNLACSFLRSLGDSFTPLIFLIASTILNIALDFLFIAAFKWGVSGAAIATLIAQMISAIGCFIYIFLKRKEYRFKKDDFKFEKGFISKHLKLGLPLAFQFSILAIGLIVMQGTMIKFDILEDGMLANEAQLGYGAACKLNAFLMTPFNALGTAMLSYSGQNLGAGNSKRIKEGIKESSIIMLVLYVLFAGLGLLLTIKGSYLYFFLSSDKINDLTIKYGNLFLRTVLPFYPFLGLLFILRNAIQGIEKPLYPLLAGICELIARTVVCLTIPTLVNGGPIDRTASDLSYIATSLADVCSWILALVPLVYAYYKYIHKMHVINNVLE